MAKNGLYEVLDNAANKLRSKMDASEYKSYLLGVIFYKYLSDQMLDYVMEYSVEEGFETFPSDTRQAFYEAVYADDTYHEVIIEDIKGTFGYVIAPEHTFDALKDSALGLSSEPFQLETFNQGMRNIEQSNVEYEGLFADVDLNSRRLGATRAKQSETIADTIKALAAIDFAEYSGDALGDAYEYLIRQFAMSAGQRAGEFYTPHEVSDLMSQIAMLGDMENKKGFTAYDATSGSGSLLLNVKKHSNEPEHIHYFGQELNTTTYNLARMNMILHGVPLGNYTLNNGDTLDEDWPTDEPTDFDAVLMNPPYSAHWSRDAGFMDDPRFGPYGKLAPKTKADYAFLLHGYYHLKSSGTMAIVLPHGVLFRGGAEATIRKQLLESGAIEAIIGLPGGIFYNTGIPTTILILKKDRVDRDVLFIDASEMYKKEGAQNVITDEHVAEIVQMYKDRSDVDKKAYLASYDEIEENDFNLNIPRYVDTFVEADLIDLRDVSAKINTGKQEIAELESELLGHLDQLVGTDDESNMQLQDFIAGYMEGVK